MEKKAQITIFVIIAVILIVAIAAFFLFKNNSNKNVVPIEIQPVYNFVTDCIQKSGNYALAKVSFYGGYDSLSDKILNIN